MRPFYFIIFSVIAAVATWLLDAAYHYSYTGPDRTLLEHIILDVPPHDLFYRVVHVVLVLALGLVLFHFSKTHARRLITEREFRVLADDFFTGVFFMQGGKFLYVNKAFADMFGYSVNELLDMTAARELIPSEDHEKALEINRLLGSKKMRTVHQELPAIKKDGTRFWIEFYASDSTYQGKPAVVGTCMDITDRKRREGTSLQASRDLRDVFASSKNVAMSISKLGPQNTLSIIEFSYGAQRLLEYSREEVMGKSPTIFHTEEVGKYLESLLDHEDVTSMSFSGKVEMTKKGGERFPAFFITYPLKDSNGNVESFIGITIDMSDVGEVEKQVRQVNERFVETMESTTDGIMIIDNDYRFSYFNSAAEKMLGVSREKVLGKKFEEAFPVVVGSEFDIQYRRALETRQPATFEQCFDIEPYANWYEVRVYPSPSGISVYFTVTTEKRQREEELHLSNMKFRLAFDSNPNLTFIVNAASEVVLDANRVFCETFGLDRESIAGMSTSDMTLEMQPSCGNIVNQCLEAGLTMQALEIDFKNSYGEARTGLLSVEPMSPLSDDAFLFTISDITDRKQMEEVLRISEERMKFALDAATDGIFDYNIVTGETYLSARWYTILEYEPYELPPNYNTWYDLIHPDDRDYVEKMVWSALDSESGAFRMEYRMLAKSGDYKWMLGRGKLVEQDKQSNARRIVGTISDITARKEMENALRENEKHLRERYHLIASGIETYDAELRLTYLNQAAIDFLELDPDTVVGESILDWNLPVYFDDGRLIATEENPIVVAWREKRPVSNVVLGFDVAVKDIRKWALVSAAPIFDSETGDLREVIVSFTDITGRRAIEEELRLGERLLSSVVESIPTGIWVADTDFNIQIWNAGQEEMTGVSRDELIGKNIFDLFPSLEKEGLKEAYIQVVETGKPYVAIEKPFYDETLKKVQYYLNIKANPLLDEYENVKGIVLAIDDVTEITLAKEELQKRQKEVETLLDNLPGAASLKDTEGRYIMVNRTSCEVIGLPEKQIIGKTDYELFNHELADFMSNGDKRAVETGRPVNIGEVQLPVQGHAMWFAINKAPLFDHTGKLLGIANLEIDITERKRAEENLAVSERKFSTAFHASPTPMFMTRLGDSIFIDANNAFCMFIGYPLSELIGQSSVDLGLHVDLFEHQRIRDHVIQKGAVKNREILLRTKRGEIRIGLLSAESVDMGTEKYLLSVISDYTERKRAEDEIRRANEELEARIERRTSQLAEANRDLESVNKDLESFNYSVSHDLRTPLRAINGYSQVLLEDYSDNLDDTGKDYLTRICLATQRMGQLINDLLTLSRMSRSSIEVRDVDLTKLAYDVVGELSSAYPDREVEVNISSGLTCLGDVQMLRVLLDNLIGNAWKFTRDSEHAKIEFGMIEEHGETIYYVYDNGAGFDMRYYNKLFGVFQRLHRDDEYEGTGVGLATVLRIVRKHGGKIWAYSEIDRGSRFYFTLKEGAEPQ